MQSGGEPGGVGAQGDRGGGHALCSHREVTHQPTFVILFVFRIFHATTFTISFTLSIPRGDADLHTIFHQQKKLSEGGKSLSLAKLRWNPKLGSSCVCSFFLLLFSSSVLDVMCRYYWEEMLLAVEQVHRRRVVHLDIKPENFIQVGASSVSTSSYTSSSSTSFSTSPPPPLPALTPCLSPTFTFPPPSGTGSP